MHCVCVCVCVCMCVCVCVEACEILLNTFKLFVLTKTFGQVSTSAPLGPGFKHQPGTRLSCSRIIVSFLQFLRANMPI